MFIYAGNYLAHSYGIYAASASKKTLLQFPGPGEWRSLFLFAFEQLQLLTIVCDLVDISDPDHNWFLFVCKIACLWLT